MLSRLLIACIGLYLTTTVCLGQSGKETAWAKRVYSRLLHTLGQPIGAPQLIVRPDVPANADMTLLYRSGSPGRIEVAARVLALCRAEGPSADAALACLLSHELAHFQYRHGSKQGFFAPVELAPNRPLASENLEAVADRAGVFTAYLAGYDAFEAAPRIYEKLYKAYRLPDRRAGYPTKKQRLRMVADTVIRVRELAQLVEISELYYLLGDYDGAAKTATLLLSRYPATTTLLNAAAIKINQALTRMRSAREEPRLRYLFPIEYDADNRLLASRRRADQPYLSLLTDALTLCQTALASEPDNQMARLNAAISMYLLERSTEAGQQLARLSMPDAVLMRAIVAAETDPRQARHLFREAVRLGAFRAVANEQLFDAAQRSAIGRVWAMWLNNRQRKQTSELPALAAPILTLPRQGGESWLPNGIQYTRTDSLTMYRLRVTANGKTRLASVWKSRVLSLPNLPINSLRSRLRAYRPSTQTIAGVRGSTFYHYDLPAGSLLLEYRNDRLAEWVMIAD